MLSNLAIGQAYYQHNAVVNYDGGAVGLTERPGALQRWIISGTDMARVINERSVDCALCTPEMNHYEQRPVVQNIFLQDVMSSKSAIGEYDNTFLETSSDLLVLATRDIVEKSVADNMYPI